MFAFENSRRSRSPAQGQLLPGRIGEAAIFGRALSRPARRHRASPRHGTRRSPLPSRGRRGRGRARSDRAGPRGRRGKVDVASLSEQRAAMPVEIVDFFDCLLDPVDRPLGELHRQAGARPRGEIGDGVERRTRARPSHAPRGTRRNLEWPVAVSIALRRRASSVLSSASTAAAAKSRRRNKAGSRSAMSTIISTRASMPFSCKMIANAREHADALRLRAATCRH